VENGKAGIIEAMNEDPNFKCNETSTISQLVNLVSESSLFASLAKRLEAQFEGYNRDISSSAHPNLTVSEIDIIVSALKATDRWVLLFEELESELKLTKEQRNEGGDIILGLVSRIDKLEAALRGVRQELWVNYCLHAGRTDIDPSRFNSTPHIRIIDTALAPEQDK
jgi:hypothetical protein